MDNYVDKIKKGESEYDIRDTTSGYMTEEAVDAAIADAAGEIQQGDTGFAVAGDVYDVIGNVESLLAQI